MPRSPSLGRGASSQSFRSSASATAEGQAAASCFSAASSVGERKGSEGRERGTLWSVSVQGKYVDQVSKALAEYGVAQVRVEAKQGAVSKKDRAANV